MDDDSTTEQDDSNSSLSNLPTELLVEIFSYLPLCDKIRMQYVSPRLKHIMEVPSLWNDFVWPNYEPLPVCSVSKILKAQGEHVRRTFFPVHVTSADILEMAQCCTKVTHLSLPRNLSLDHLEAIVNETPAAAGCVCQWTKCKIFSYYNWDEKTNIKVYDYPVYNFNFLISLLEGIKQHRNSLPSVINIYVPWHYHAVENKLLQFWSTWSSKLPSFEVGLYEIRRVPMNLYPSIPLLKFQFGPAATPPLIQLTDHGILDIQDDTFHFTDYDYYDEVRHSITAKLYDLYAVKEYHFTCISNLYSVSNVDFRNMNIHPGHLEQLAIACPNLERINLAKASRCLQNLKGLQAVVEKCQNLQGINLAGISISCVEGNLHLWKLLSSVKKLTHLAINLSMLTYHGNSDDADQQKFIGLLKSCDALQALEVIDEHYYCTADAKNLLFSHLPSLVYINLVHFQHTGSLEYSYNYQLSSVEIFVQLQLDSFNTSN